MKFIFYFHLLIYITVVIAYSIEPVFGALFQLPLGILQFITAIWLSKSVSRKNKKLQNIYFYVVSFWAISFTLLCFSIDFNEIHKAFLFPIPMGIGCYFIILTYLLTKTPSL